MGERNGAYRTGRHTAEAKAERQAARALLRVRPESLDRIAELAQHKTDGGEAKKRESVSVEIFPIFGEATTAVEPGDGAFDDPAFGQNDEAFGLVRALDDFGFQLRQDLRQRAVKDASRIGAVGKQLFKKWIDAEERGQQQDAAVAILNIGGMHDRVQQQTQRVYKNVPLLAFDLLSRIVTGRVDTRPPFSALFTLWLSMMAAVGLSSRTSCSRHLRYSAW
jgi:hypothetical protein